mgnify:CR=1 FL=1
MNISTRSITGKYFYPRPPRGGRPFRADFKRPIKLFLSTPSARRATNNRLSASVNLKISIHALREEGDDKRSSAARLYKEFLSTPSARRATVMGWPCCARSRISIHALREEGD